MHSVRRHVIGCALIVASAAAAAGGAPAPAASAQPAGASMAAKKAAAPAKLIDINSASRAQLETLPGIGHAEADKIIAGRPYLSKVHVVTEAGLPFGTYQAIRHQIVAVQNEAARAKLKTLASAPQAPPR